MPLTAQDKREIAAIVDGIMMKYQEGQAIADPTQNLMQTAMEGLQAQQRLQALTTRLEQSPGIQRPEDILISQLIDTAIVPKKRKKAMTKFNRAVKEGMKIVRSSSSYGKKGTISNSKKAFSAVTKAVSRARKGGKLPKKGVLRKVQSKAKSILGKIKARAKKRGPPRGPTIYSQPGSLPAFLKKESYFK
jgi:hypothetical protein